MNSELFISPVTHLLSKRDRVKAVGSGSAVDHLFSVGKTKFNPNVTSKNKQNTLGASSKERTESNSIRGENRVQGDGNPLNPVGGSWSFPKETRSL